MHLGLSYACNMRCSHCFADKSRDLIKKEDYYKLIDEMYELGLFVLYYTYGEPLYCPFFFEIAEYVKKKGIVQVLMTNGYLLNETMADRIKKAGISKVFVSLDHIKKEEHDRNRGVCGSYEAALSALAYLKKAGVNCAIATTVTEKNADVLFDIEDLAVSMDVKNVSFLRVRKDGAIRSFEEPKRKAYVEFFKDVLKRNPAGMMFHDMELIPILTELYRTGEISEEIYEKYLEMNLCHAQYTACVEPSGDVSRCNLNKQVIGNILNDTISDILLNNHRKEGSCTCETN